MTETEPKPFGGFEVSHPSRTFEVTGRDFQLARRWLRTSASEARTEFLTSMHGCFEGDDVCVLGTDKRSKIFHTTISSDSNIEESWRNIRRIDLLVDKLSDPERWRIRGMQHEVFDKSPPTATLFYHQGHWSMECEIPLPVLTQFSADFVACGVDKVLIRIEWPFAFIDRLSGSWGFFEGGQLRGHVCSFTWSSPAERANRANA